MNRIFCENRFQVKQAEQKSWFRSFRFIWKSQSSWSWKGSLVQSKPWQGRVTWSREHRSVSSWVWDVATGMCPAGQLLLMGGNSSSCEEDEVSKLSLCRAVGQSHSWGCSSIRSSPKLWLSTSGSAPRIRSSSKVITMDCLLF